MAHTPPPLRLPAASPPAPHQAPLRIRDAFGGRAKKRGGRLSQERQAGMPGIGGRFAPEYAFHPVGLSRSSARSAEKTSMGGSPSSRPASIGEPTLSTRP